MAFKREILAVDAFSLVEIGVEIDLGRLYRGVAEVLLYDPEILGAPVEFAGVTVPNLMRRYAGRSILAKDDLNGAG